MRLKFFKLLKKKLDYYRVFCYNNIVKKVVNLKQLSKEKLIELYIKKCEEYDALEAKFYQEQKEKNEALKELEKFKEKDALNRQRLFGVKSEKSSVLNKNTFNEAEENKNNNKKENQKKNHGKKKGSKNFDIDFLEKNFTKTEYVEPAEIEELKKNPNIIELSSDVSYKVTRIPAKFEITKIICKKYFDKIEKRFYQGIKENDPYPHSICTPELATDIMINKFMYGLPYYRQSEVVINDGLYISRQDMCNYQIRTTDILKPFYDFLREKLLQTQSKVICADETTLRVLKTEKLVSYMRVYISTFYDHPIYIYEYCQTREKERVSKFLQDYRGYLLTDGYVGYKNHEGVINAYCWAHARRKFADIEKSLSEEQLKVSKASEIRISIDKLFDLEKEFKENKYGPKKIKEERNNKEYINVLNNVFDKIENCNPKEGTALFRATEYVLGRKDGFKTFLENGYIDLSNNISERAIKPFVIARKNFLFSNTENGAESSAIFFSILQTARANNLNPQKYITFLIKKLCSDKGRENFEELLPRKYNENSN